MNCRGFNIEPLCSDVCGYHRRPQTLAEICRYMDSCCGFRTVAAREKYPGLTLLMQFYKQQRVGHYFNLHARVPSAEVGLPRWIDKRIDATWQRRPWATLAQIMACCLTSPSHYLNQRWLFVKGFVWHSAESNFIRHAHALNPKNLFADCIFKTIAISPRGQWVNKLHWYLIGSIYISAKKMHFIKLSMK